MRVYKTWSKQETRQLKKLFKLKMPKREIYETLGRTQGSVDGKLHHLGLYKVKKKKQVTREKSFLKRKYGNTIPVSKDKKSKVTGYFGNIMSDTPFMVTDVIEETTERGIRIGFYKFGIEVKLFKK